MTVKKQLAKEPKIFEERWPVIWKWHLNAVEKITANYLAALNAEWEKYERDYHETWRTSDRIWKSDRDHALLRPLSKPLSKPLPKPESSI